MKIFAFSFTCGRDLELSDLMVSTLKKYCPNLGGYYVKNTDGQGYGNGAGWEASMMKLDGLRDLVNRSNPKDDDFLLSVDSDTIFCASEVFNHISPEYGIIGIMHQGEPANTFIGHLNQFSGCAIFIRGDIAKKMCAISRGKLDTIRQNFKMYVLIENEDVVLSYLAQLCGAKPFNLPSHLHSGNFEADLKANNLSSFYHLNYLPGTFLGRPCPGKWDIPKVLRHEGIDLCATTPIV